ncbi:MULTISPECIES: hypothetical protein [Streptomyces rochei group]|uniref:Restriction endonuclease n=1 Tax=Streptomyces plicatus TaxID=1922 RepID=A0ABW1Y464_STRPL|nr:MULTISPECIES: hypothetical protein [Streptomyces rochei group]GGZ33447.1 hypothetical protein GCM10010301_00910 [Streptomyces plicatus]GHC30226.1 hypothetical protein GCM10010308_54810 [Streptomyces vinaceusdrappus]
MSGTDSLSAIKEFERALDSEYESRKIFEYSPASVITDAAGALTLTHTKNTFPPEFAGFIDRGLDAALPPLINARHGREADMDYGSTLINDLMFMSHYYMLREYLYYSYNSPGSFTWDFSGRDIRISFADPSIPRHFTQYANSRLLDLARFYQRYSDLSASAISILREKEELGSGRHIQEAFRYISQEARERIKTQFEILGGSNSTVPLKGYSYAHFYSIYEFLLSKCLYHRYHARAHGTWSTFQYAKHLLPQEISTNTNIEEEVVRKVLKDISYSRKNRRLPPMYFGMIDHEDLPHYILVPDRFIENDGLAQLLRVQASKDPAWFLSHVSVPIGKNFTEKIAQKFREAGFFAATNVSMDDAGPGLPDIDILVVSREPTLGYYVFTCEVKAPLPGLWAKDYLRAIHADSLPKAFAQVHKIHEALATQEGQRLLLEKIGALDPQPLSEGLIPIQGIVITSQNSGMFFEEQTQKTHAIDYHTLSHILEMCDGDTVYVIKTLKDLRRSFEPEIRELSVEVGEISVTYEVASDKGLIDFPRNHWKSVGRDVEVAEEFFREGGSPFDVLSPPES